MENSIRRNVLNSFKLTGLNLSSDGQKYLFQILRDFDAAKQNLWLEKIINKLLLQRLGSELICKSVVESAVKECSRDGSQNHQDILSVISAFEIPRLCYDIDRKKFHVSSTLATSLLCDAGEKSRLFRERYSMLLQRTLHHDLFSPEVEDPGAGRDDDDEEEGSTKFTLKTVEFLAGSSSKIGGVIVLGMIAQLKEGKYYLEDPTGSVELDISGTTFQSGLFAENCFVLAEGYWEDQIFYVTAMGLPPPEDAKASRSFYGSTNFFGGPPSNVKRERLALIERENEDSMFVILSDVHLDKIQVLEKLRVLFAGYAEARPLLFIFMGNFLSEPHGTQSSVALRDALKTLADVILEFPVLVESSRFVFIPGPQDPGFVNILPRPAFAEVITEYVRTKIPHAIFATNPCRIKYCTKEIIVVREDIFTKFSRNAIRFPEEGNIADHFVMTIVAQGHLCPLPLHICPVYWPFDHALYVYPLPNIVIVADKSNPFTITRNECTFTNPGPFVKTNFSFQTYTPFTNKIDDCQLPSET